MTLVRFYPEKKKLKSKLQPRSSFIINTNIRLYSDMQKSTFQHGVGILVFGKTLLSDKISF